MQASTPNYKYLDVVNASNKLKYQDLRAPTGTIDGNSIVANNKFMAMTWASTGTASREVHVRPIAQFGKITLQDSAFLSGHEGNVTDLCFAPFYDNILASASQDNTVRIWNIADEDAVQGKESSEAVLKGHGKKIIRCVWHPTSDFTLATGALDKTIKLWDVHNQACGYSFDLGESPHSMAFNRDGSQIVATCRDRKIYTVDPRQTATAQQGACMDAPKANRVTWNTQSGKIFVVGTEMSERMLFWYDQRDITKPVKKERIDNSLCHSYTHYNAENHLLYLMSKGSQVMDNFLLDETKETCTKLPRYNAKTNLVAMSFMDKTCVDPFAHEVDRAIRSDGKEAEYVSVRIPLKSSEFQTKYYPDYPAMEPQMKFEDYAAGKNAEVKLVAHSQDRSAVKSSQIGLFAKKDPNVEVRVVHAEPKVIKEKVVEMKEVIVKESQQEDLDEISQLKKKVTQLEQEVASKDSTIKQTQDESVKKEQDWATEKASFNEQTKRLLSRVKELEASEAELMSKLGLAIKKLFKPTTVKKSYTRSQLTMPVLGYWDIRGLAQGLRYQLKYIGVDFENKVYETTEEVQSTSDWRMTEKKALGIDFPNLPYFLDTDGYAITETLAIHEYIAAKWAPELLGATYQDRATINMIQPIMHQLKIDSTMPCYMGQLSQEEIANIIKEKLTPIVEFMNKRGGEAILGDSNLTYLDFYFFEYVLYAEMITNEQVFDWYPILKQYKYYMAELPYLSSYLESEDPCVTSYPFNMRFAFVNNWKKPVTEETAANNDAVDEDASLSNPYGEIN